MSESYQSISFLVKFRIVSVDENFHPLNELVRISVVTVWVGGGDGGRGWGEGMGVLTQAGAGRSRKSKKMKHIPFGNLDPNSLQI